MWLASLTGQLSFAPWKPSALIFRTRKQRRPSARSAGGMTRETRPQAETVEADHKEETTTRSIPSYR
ncbi:hypothetical protein DWB63_13250 [Pseudodesulfovibrio sp. S3]|nr:hypothetical protein DWB63_13250 [Pseudodesulfovibrio sp. S3]